MVIMKPTTHFQCGLSKVAIRLSTGPVNCEVCSSSSNSINSSLILFSVTNDGRVGLVFPARTETTFTYIGRDTPLITLRATQPAERFLVHTRNFHFEFIINPRLDIVNPAVH